MLSFTIKPFTCSKEGNSFEENEDAFLALSKQGDSNIRVAIADGATESSFSREWADLLVSYFDVFKYSSSFNSTLLPIIRKSWLARINVDDLPWYAQQKLELGAFASFLGMDINLDNGNADIIAVGDSNLFVFRNDKMELTFPVEKSVDFGNTPFLISSEPSKNHADEKFFLQKIFTLASEDTVILSTDAISQWILKEQEAGNNPEKHIYKLFNQENYQSAIQDWLDEARKVLEIKNDDTTIILIQFADGITEG